MRGLVMVKSLLQRNKACYICGTTLNLHYHHIFFGTANRKLDLTLKARCQIEYMRQNNKTVEDFIERYGRNYL